MKTNKTFKRIASVSTAAILAACVAVPMTSFNAEAATITINNSETGHVYQAYQIFKGDLSGTGSTAKLSNINWGSNVDQTQIIVAVTGITLSDNVKPFNNMSNAEDIANKLAEYTDDSEVAKKFAAAVSECLTGTPATSNEGSGSYTISTTDDGYYLVMDKADEISGADDFNKSHTRYIIEVADNVTVNAKSGLPTLDKQVLDVNDSITKGTDGYSDYADHDIGDLVEFKLIGTLPSNFNAYSTYSYKIVDTLAAGFTYVADSAELKVTIDGNDVTSNFTPTLSGNTLTISCDNLVGVSGAGDGKEVIVTYKAKLNDNAVVGSAGNENAVYLEYSNNPNGTGTGKTTTEKVKVYTYEVDVKKFYKDGSIDKDLIGAGFTLYKIGADNSEKIVKKIESTNNVSTFTFTGLDDGRYKLVEDTAPTGYNKLKDPIYFEISADHPSGYVEPTMQSKSDNTFASNGSYTINVTDGKGELKVENKAGSTLPSTGGIGTTPFFVGGGVLVAGAGIYLIVRKRMKNNNDK